jgi:hypothetical protein
METSGKITPVISKGAVVPTLDSRITQIRHIPGNCVHARNVLMHTYLSVWVSPVKSNLTGEQKILVKETMRSGQDHRSKLTVMVLRTHHTQATPPHPHATL